LLYLVYERESYCEYTVVYVSPNKSKAESIINEYKDKRFWIEEIELEQFKETEW
jgi:hypothetical protein